jgi:NitT/TauT family transport system permease protein
MTATEPLRKGLESRVARPMIFLTAVLVLWDLAVRILDIPPFIVPAPASVLVAFWAQWHLLVTNMLITFEAIFAGWILCIGVGILIAVAIVHSPTVERLLYPMLVLWQGVPKIAIAPLFVVWFGFGMTTRIFLAFIVGLFAMIVSTVSGLKSAETDLLDLARAMNATKWQTLSQFTFPNALPAIFSGLRITAVQACSGAVTAEFVGSNSGIGYILLVAVGNFNLPLMFAALALLALTGLLLFVLVDRLEALALPWHVSHRSLNAAA